MNGDEPVLDDAGRRLDQIRVVGVTATGHHGVLAAERRDGQQFVADVVLHMDTRRAAAGDDLAQTVDYGVLARQVHAVLAGDPVDLIETVAERIAATAMAYPGVRAVDVDVHKPQAALGVPFGDVLVHVRRDRSKLPAAEPYRGPIGERAGGEPAVTGPTAEALAPDHAETAPHVADIMDERPAAPVDIVLALGANLGAAQQTLRDAVTELSATPDLEVTRVSALARTASVGGPEQPDYLNAVLLGRTTMSPRELLATAHRLEGAHGRQRGVRWGPRTLDIDIVVYGSTLAVADDLELPHPRAHERAFVLAPWAQVDPDAVLPGLGGGPVALLADTAPDRDGMRWLALDWLTGPAPASAPQHPPVAEDERVPPSVPAAAPGDEEQEPAALPPPFRWPTMHEPDDGEPRLAAPTRP